MTDNIFEIETTALAHVACAPRESGILWTFCRGFSLCESFLDFSRAPRWQSCLRSFVVLLPMTCCDSTTHVEFTGMTRDQFFMTRGVRQGCPATSCLRWLSIPVFRFLQDLVIPRNPDGLDILQTVQNASADDLAVAASFFRDLMSALSHLHSALWTVLLGSIWIIGRKCCWVQYGSEGRESLLRWLSDNCEDFREMQVVRKAKCAGTMIRPDVHIHCWTAP